MNSNPNSKCMPVVDLIANPDCLKCMRKKLRATSVVVFFKQGNTWLLDNFQGDKPGEAAEVECQYMLTTGLPETVLTQGKSFFLNDQASIERLFPKVANLFKGSCVIAAPVRGGKNIGVRIAWRDAADPFSNADLATIECSGQCPEGCA